MSAQIDVVEELAGLIPTLEPRWVVADKSSDIPVLDERYQLSLGLLDYYLNSVDHLVERTGLTVSKVSSMLLILELNGSIVYQVGGLYARTALKVMQ